MVFFCIYNVKEWVDYIYELKIDFFQKELILLHDLLKDLF